MLLNNGANKIETDVARRRGADTMKITGDAPSSLSE
jgi:hypothetical protein